MLRRLIPTVMLLFIAAGLPPQAAIAQTGMSSDVVSVEIKPLRTEVSAGDDIPLAVIFDIEPGWHIWTNDRELPDGLESWEHAIATGITVVSEAPDVLRAFERFIHWPQAHGFIADLGDGPQNFAVFDGRAVAFVPVSISHEASPGEYTLTFRLTYQACDDMTCLAPVEGEEHSVLFSVVENAEPVESTGVFTSVPPDLFDRIPPDASVIPDGAASPSTEVLRPSFFGLNFTLTDGVFGLLALALLSAIGGFVLNLTPCVLPVIPIKIMTVMQHANRPGKNLMLGAWMAVGVIAFWVAIGTPVAIFRTVSDPSQLFGIWWVTLGIGALIALMGVGIMGLFTFQLPRSVYMVNPKADTAFGSFLFGVMTAVLGLPCFGFVAGALLAGAATQPASTIMLIFTSLGIGMAAPYFVLSAKPSLIEKIPRTGPASELVKQVMGLLLLAAAAYFVGSGLIALVAENPFLGRQLHVWAVAAFAAAAGVWLVLRTLRIAKTTAPRVAFTLIGLAVAAAGVLYAVDSTSKARSNWETLQAAIAAAGGVGEGAYAPGAWNRYTPAALERARADGHIVVLDFTAEWCINCKVLKATVLNREPVKSELARGDVVNFTVDLTSRVDPGWQLLDDLGQQGIPLLAIFTPGSDRPWQSNAYTPQQVIDAVNEARNRAVAAR